MRLQKNTRLLAKIAVALYAAAFVITSVTAYALPSAVVSTSTNPLLGSVKNADMPSLPIENLSTAPVVTEPVAPVEMPSAIREEAKPQPVAEVVPYEHIPVFNSEVAFKGNTATDVILNTYSGLGKFKLSFYCPCRKCNGNTHKKTASGTTLTVGRTVAVDRNTIPLGTVIHIDGLGDFIAEDTGSAIKSNKIDVLVPTHSQALALGIKYANVYVKR